MVKTTSLAALISVMEVVKVGQQIIERSQMIEPKVPTASFWIYGADLPAVFPGVLAAVMVGGTAGTTLGGMTGEDGCHGTGRRGLDAWSVHGAQGQGSENVRQGAQERDGRT